jgi:diaminopimelate epimerase
LIKFRKYEAAGNDFIMIDDRVEQFDTNDQKLVARLCDRHFGIGADGLILIRELEGYDYRMVYFNADGQEGSFCGNGGRACFHFARALGIVEEEARFMAYDGMHDVRRTEDGRVALQMRDVHGIEEHEDHFILDTGSPHWVELAENLEELDVVCEGRKRRNRKEHIEVGINVNFIEKKEDHFLIRTYERGVEDETLACGTGITASALSLAVKMGWDEGRLMLKARGGEVEVSFRRSGNGFTDIWLIGPAKLVYQGEFPSS